jgi:hypothetical protein
VHAQGVGPDVSHHARDVCAGELTRLHYADVAEHQRARGPFANLIRPGGLGLALHGPLASEAESESARFCDGGKVAIHFCGALRAARHRGDHDGQAQRFAEQLHGGVDLVCVQVRQRLVNELDALEQGRRASEGHLVRGTEVEMVVFAALDFGAHRQPRP